SDLIRGKGRGLIILLNGRRGQDLSLTVEVIAKIMRRPLHRIRCTDLSHLRAADFEKVLKTQLSTSFQERAIVLMDEADMLLATRTMNELSRNAMVSITLRMMEYFQGILFLTATRVCTVDEAYRSRIHLSLHYPKMDRPSAIQVWKSELQCLRVEGGLTFNERDVMAFAKRSFTRTPDWNARQIHDIVRSAKELATHEHVKSMRTRKNRVPWSQPDQPVMTTNHLKRAAKACEYLKEEDDVEESDMEDSHIEEVEMSVETLALT
ncbi:P-loop containing nucleoside triphosphate hydrolase protein, partial [Lentithecium fluviatile CBS 122367]